MKVRAPFYIGVNNNQIYIYAWRFAKWLKMRTYYPSSSVSLNPTHEYPQNSPKMSPTTPVD